MSAGFVFQLTSRPLLPRFAAFFRQHVNLRPKLFLQFYGRFLVESYMSEHAMRQ